MSINTTFNQKTTQSGEPPMMRMTNSSTPPLTPKNCLPIFVYNDYGKLIREEQQQPTDIITNNNNSMMRSMPTTNRWETNPQTPLSVSPFQPLLPIPNFSHAFIVGNLPPSVSVRRKNRKMSEKPKNNSAPSKIMAQLELSVLNNQRRIVPKGPLADISNIQLPQQESTNKSNNTTPKKPRIRQLMLTTPLRESLQSNQSARSKYIDEEANNYSINDSPETTIIKTSNTKDSEHKAAMAINLGLSTDDFECKPFETTTLPSVIDKNYLVVDKEGCTQLALLPNHIPTSVCKLIEVKCRKVSNLRHALKIQKASFYVNWWTKSQPMGYMCKDNESEIGKVVNEIAELLSDHCRNLLRMCNERVYKKISELKEDKFFAPCICFNILEHDLESRITKFHHDKMDYGVSVLFYFGDYSRGNLNVLDAGSSSTIVTRPGDAVILRGNYYKHSVQNIEPGNNKARYSIVFFAHSTHFLKKKYELSPAAAKKAFLVDNPDFVSIKKRKQASSSSDMSVKKPKKSTEDNVEFIQTHTYLGNGYKSGHKNYQYYVKFNNIDQKEWKSYESLPKQAVASYWVKFKKLKSLSNQ